MTVAYFSRRSFLQSATAISTATALAGRANGSNSRSIDYVRTAESIDVYRTEAKQKWKLQSVASQRPSSLTLDTTGQYLFAVNEIDQFQGLPTGSVESFGVEPGTGHLGLISRKPLSLSATMPRQFALSPNGRYLVVAVYGGGLYNVLSVRSNGEIGGITQVIKEVGYSVHRERQSSAHTHSVVFHPSGEFLIGTDLGADRINVFRFEDGYMTPVHRVPTACGSGPAGLAINSSGSHVLVEHEFGPLLARYCFNSRTGELARAETSKT